MNGVYVHLIEGEHTDGVGHGGGRGRVRLTAIIGRSSSIRPIGDARVNGERSMLRSFSLNGRKTPIALASASPTS
jgi:hypothetical protein